MRVALLITVRNDWDSVRQLLAQIQERRAAEIELDWSVWIVDDGSAERPPSWNALASPGLDHLHVIELHGTYGRERSLAIGLAYLVMEAQETCDAYILLGGRAGWECAAAQLPILLAAHDKESQCVLLGKRSPLHRLSPPGLGWLFYRTFFRCCTGETFEQADLLLMPPQHAEALCHSAHAGNHLAAAITKLRLPLRSLPLGRANARPALRRVKLTSLVTEALNAIAVFREIVFVRVLLFSFALASLSLCGVLFSWAGLLPGAWAPPLLLASGLFFFFFSVSLFLSLGALSLREMRLWTPALDSATLIRCVNRVKRAPYPLSSSPAR